MQALPAQEEIGVLAAEHGDLHLQLPIHFDGCIALRTELMYLLRSSPFRISVALLVAAPPGGGGIFNVVVVVPTLAQRAKGKGARDRTRYSKARSGTKSFLTHHCGACPRLRSSMTPWPSVSRSPASSSRRSAASRMRRVRARSRRNAGLVA